MEPEENTVRGSVENNSDAEFSFVSRGRTRGRTGPGLGQSPTGAFTPPRFRDRVTEVGALLCCTCMGWDRRSWASGAHDSKCESNFFL